MEKSETNNQRDKQNRHKVPIGTKTGFEHYPVCMGCH